MPERTLKWCYKVKSWSTRGCKHSVCNDNFEHEKMEIPEEIVKWIDAENKQGTYRYGH